jgi:hypothetical protein
MANREKTDNWLKNLPTSEKAEMMFKIKKEKKKLANEIDNTFKRINSLGNKEMFAKSTTQLLSQIQSYLEVDAKYIYTKFSKDEFVFSKKINLLDSNENSNLKKYFPFLESKSEKRNRILIRKINNLIKQKKETIEKYHKNDIQIVNGFLKYTTYKLKTGEVFYFIPDNEGISWTKKEFVKNLSNYFLYKLKLDPESLTQNYINDMKGHYSFIGLGVDSMEKTKLANNYFQTNNDAFNFGFNKIPNKYDEVADLIRLVPVVMMKNEQDLQEIIDFTIEEYNK